MKRLTIAIAVVGLLAAACGPGNETGPAPAERPATTTETAPAGAAPASVTATPEPAAPPTTAAPTTATSPAREPAVTTVPPAANIDPSGEPGLELKPPHLTQSDLLEGERWHRAFTRLVRSRPADDAVAVRRGPGRGEPVIATLASGARVRLRGVRDGSWQQIHTVAGEGWVHRSHLAPVPVQEEPFGSDGTWARGTGWFTLRGVRLFAADGFDRLEFEVVPDEEGGVPGLEVLYVEPPLWVSSGEVTSLDGTAFLGVTLWDTVTWDRTTFDPTYDGPWRLRGDAVMVTEVIFEPDIEGFIGIYLGLETEAPFRVTVLDDPLRFVVDVVHRPPVDR